LAVITQFDLFGNELAERELGTPMTNFLLEITQTGLPTGPGKRGGATFSCVS